jgi:hypothetical protein
MFVQPDVLVGAHIVETGNELLPSRIVRLCNLGAARQSPSSSNASITTVAGSVSTFCDGVGPAPQPFA